MIELGPVEQNIAKQAYRSGEPVPERILNAPRLAPGLEMYMTAFIELDTERHHGTGPMPIPWSSIMEYADRYNFTQEEADELHFFVRKMDDAHVERLHTKFEAERNKT